MAEGDAASAATLLKQAIGVWTEVDAPFEVARARLLLTDAYRALDQPERAAIEARTARDAFERLGAALDLRRAETAVQELTGGPDAAPLGMTTRRMQRILMFTDIVDSTRLAEALGDEAWDRIIRAHDRVVRAAVAQQGGEEVKATGDGFFLAFTDADQAFEAAVVIQRRLAGLRPQGFVPEVRIGIHGAEVNRVGLDYTGSGVNLAARIGKAADGGEILVSATTLSGARHSFAEIGRRNVELKGLSALVEVVSIGWS